MTFCLLVLKPELSQAVLLFDKSLLLSFQKQSSSQFQAEPPKGGIYRPLTLFKISYPALSFISTIWEEESRRVST